MWDYIFCTKTQWLSSFGVEAFDQPTIGGRSTHWASTSIHQFLSIFLNSKTLWLLLLPFPWCSFFKHNEKGMTRLLAANNDSEQWEEDLDANEADANVSDRRPRPDRWRPAGAPVCHSPFPDTFVHCNSVCIKRYFHNDHNYVTK